MQPGLGVPLGAAALLVRSVLRTVSRHEWRGLENLPDGGCVIAANHVSWLDPVTLADVLVAAGPVPRILAKESLFGVPVLGGVLRTMRGVPVSRGTGDAAVALQHAVDAVRGGDRVVIFPDGTLTKDPDGWPMVGKTGAARLALTTGAPLVPLAQWGPQQLLPRQGRPRLFPRPTMRALVGEPLDLSAYQGRPLTQAVLREVTELVVDAVAELLSQLRGEPVPPRWDPRTGTRRPAVGGGPVPPAARPEVEGPA
ncbi:1-acyl-sn-glycerol-3-phosphate acyltransferase [Quadrisphaera sp. RL12-1S]|nr:1-acyl-sn-glycerol-3-phosphate acyltransferase [Quadrisphaera sp. RL12-1S]